MNKLLHILSFILIMSILKSHAGVTSVSTLSLEKNKTTSSEKELLEIIKTHCSHACQEINLIIENNTDLKDLMQSLPKDIYLHATLIKKNPPQIMFFLSHGLTKEQAKNINTTNKIHEVTSNFKKTVIDSIRFAVQKNALKYIDQSLWK